MNRKEKTVNHKGSPEYWIMIIIFHCKHLIINFNFPNPLPIGKAGFSKEKLIQQQ